MDRMLVFSFEKSSAEKVFDFEVTVEVNEFSEPFAAEVFGIADSLGVDVAIHAASLLVSVVSRASYDSEVDSLSFSFGDGTRSGGQVNGVLQVGLGCGGIAVIQLLR